VFEQQKEIVLATPKKNSVKKRSAKKARKTRRATTKAAASKRRAKKSKRAAGPAKKTAKKAVKKTATRKNTATKKAARKSSKQTTASKAGPTRVQANVAGKKPSAGKSTKAGSSAKPAVRAVKPKLPAESNSYYITTAIAYPNGTPHIGHAYEAIATDALARFARLDGKDVFFLTGTDEHGQKMIQTAQAEGMTPSDLATRNAGRFKEMDQRLNVGFDRFIRTSEPAHHRSVQEMRRATFISTLMPAGIRYAMKPITPRKKLLSARTKCVVAHRERRSIGLRRRAISSSCPPIRAGCLRFTTTNPISSDRIRAATKSSAL